MRYNLELDGEDLAMLQRALRGYVSEWAGAMPDDDVAHCERLHTQIEAELRARSREDGQTT